MADERSAAMAGPDIREPLAACPLLADVDADALDALAGRSTLRRFARGETVFAQGDPGGSLFVLASGAVRISVRSADGSEIVLGLLRAPHAFGEIAVVDGGRRVADATAVGRCTAVSVPRACVLELMATHPQVATALLGSLVAMIRHVDEQASDLALLRLPQRVAKLLLAAAREQVGGAAVPGSSSVNLVINQTDLAHQVGGSRQAVNGVLMALEHAGVIERSGRRVISVRLDLLELRGIG
jgi:CRP/FNR family transcriptional regulator, cyclic AMP receptor protein